MDVSSSFAGSLRVALVGKGGAGKSTIGGTLARVLAHRGHRVLALDVGTICRTNTEMRVVQ